MAVFGIGGDKRAIINPMAAGIVETSPSAGPETVELKGSEHGKEQEIARWESKISETEHVIREIYGDIGEKYCELHADDAESALASMIHDVKGRKELIKEYRGRINELKGIIVCDKCGAELKNTATFCTECGNKIKKNAESAPSGFITCKNCNSFLEAGAKFCSVCGYKVEETISFSKLEPKAAASVPLQHSTVEGAVTESVKENVSEPLPSQNTEEQPPVVTLAPEEVKPAGKECPYCGQKLEEFDVMCFACGNKL